MSYNEGENNRYPQNQNGYSNNVPKPTFSGVVGKDNTNGGQFQNIDMNNGQPQYGFTNYQILNGYQSNPFNYGNNYNNYQNPNSNGMTYYPPVSYAQNDQLANNIYTPQFQNTQQVWSRDESDNRVPYKADNSDIHHARLTNNHSLNGYESNKKSKRDMISYEDVVTTAYEQNKKPKKQSNLTQQKQFANTDCSKPQGEEQSVIRSEPAKARLNSNNTNQNKTDKIISKTGSEIPDNEVPSTVQTKDKLILPNCTSDTKDSGEDDDDVENNKKNSINIQGTSIKLDTDEEIAKWKEERKRMWLLKISNRKEEHMKAMGIKEVDLKNTSVLNEARKQKRFIQSIESQVHRYDPNANLNLKVVQRGMSAENDKILEFIQELGDAGLLEHELTPEEKDKLFGGLNIARKKPFRNNNKPYGNLQKKRLETNKRYENNRR
ncbi:hypothetical protein C6P45_003310 [Maudiozyma exigua]|uniref:FMR1-interacting protein 1 conserved domain-containing protein n=1 Tax=Maudiozyma exigua TaxID=34358 RepID=A0A9P6WC58_MAUEX|nr:hypothetical protein C6P45_003310 [Kazachstania exigua]